MSIGESEKVSSTYWHFEHVEGRIASYGMSAHSDCWDKLDDTWERDYLFLCLNGWRRPLVVAVC